MHATRALRLPFRMGTNVRFFAARLGFTALSRVAPARPRRSPGQAVFSRGRAFTVRVETQRLAAWRFGHGPAVLLLHGWSGRAAQLSSFVSPLVDAGFSVVAFDAPGHGGSGRGLSSAPQFARALRAVAAAAGPLHAVVAHSLGAAATALAMRHGLEVGRVVFLAPPANPPAWVASFASRLGIPAPVITRMRERSERRLRLRWSELDVPALATDRTAPLLVVHDRRDAEVAFRDGQAVAAAWPGAVLVETSGLGHSRLLRDPGVVSRVVAFVAAGSRPRCPHCGRPVRGSDAPCEQCHIERHLFDRERAAHPLPDEAVHLQRTRPSSKRSTPTGAARWGAATASRRGELVALGTATDPYQPGEWAGGTTSAPPFRSRFRSSRATPLSGGGSSLGRLVERLCARR